jgi:hypothetical protein
MLTLSAGIIIVIVVLAFLCEYMDSTLGMGYGTTLSAKSVKRISAQRLKLAIGIITIILGSVTIIKAII